MYLTIILVINIFYKITNVKNLPFIQLRLRIINDVLCPTLSFMKPSLPFMRHFLPTPISYYFKICSVFKKRREEMGKREGKKEQKKEKIESRE